MSVPYPKRTPLAATPTALQPLLRTSSELGVELLIKRDDLTGLELSGNKVRKLEFLMAEAIEAGTDVVITGGGAQSNHCRATAFAATRLGMRSHLLLRTPDPSAPPDFQANLLLDRLAGATVQWITPAQWQERETLFQEVADQLRANGKTPYIIPEGGINALGAWGYVRAAEELGSQLAELKTSKTTIVYACGSGGTGAGLILGNKLLGLDARIVGVNVCDDAAYFQKRIGAICKEFTHRFGVPDDIHDSDIEILDGYVGLGYALSRDDELATIANIARTEGVLLDPVYSGKAFHGMRKEVEKKPDAFGDRIVFLHTGGAFGLFALSDRFESILDQANER